MSELAKEIVEDVARCVTDSVRIEVVAAYTDQLEHESNSWKINCRKLEQQLTDLQSMATVAADDAHGLRTRLARLEEAARRVDLEAAHAGDCAVFSDDYKRLDCRCDCYLRALRAALGDSDED